MDSNEHILNHVEQQLELNEQEVKDKREVIFNCGLLIVAAFALGLIVGAEWQKRDDKEKLHNYRDHIEHLEKYIKTL